MRKSVLSSPFRSPCGIALVVTLTLLALITILVVGFTASMRTEHQASHSMAENQRVTLVAQNALAHAVSILSNNIPQPAAPGPVTTAVNWVVNPGLLTTITGSGASPTITRVPLSTNPSDTYQPSSSDANLNVPILTGGGGYTILPTGDPMCAAWVPVLQDPLAAASAANPLAARYAFWIDDENARINVNTAVGKPSAGLDFSQRTPGYVAAGSAQYPLGHPGSVNLDVLGTFDTNSLVNAISASGPLASPEAVKPYVSGGDPTAFFNANKFALTAWSRDPEFNVFGKSRFFLTRRMTGQLGVSVPAFQFFRDADAPLYAPTDENKNNGDVQSLYYTAAGLSSLLGRTDWPGMPTGSFADKWDRDNAGAAIPGAVPGEVGRREADQFAWNLVTLAHFADGSFGSTVPARWTDYTNLRNRTTPGQTGYVGSANRPNSTAMLGASSGKAILPAYPAPMVSEVCLVVTPVTPTGVSPAPPAGSFWLNVSMRVELWLPPGYSKCDMTALGTTVGLTYLSYTVSQGSVTATQTDTKYRDATNGNGISVLYCGPSNPPALVMDPTGTASGAFATLTTTKNFYVRNDQATNPSFSNSGSGAPYFTATGGPVSLDFKMRLYAGSFSGTIPNDTTAPRQLIPTWDSRDPGTAAASSWNPTPPTTPVAAFRPPADDPKDYLEFNFQLDAADFTAGTAFTRSLEIADPRESGLARMWVPAANFNDPTQQDANSLGRLNDATAAAIPDLKKFACLDFNESSVAYSKPPSIGVISLLPTGMQRGIPGATVRLQPCQNSSVLPDWLLLDLVAPTPVALDLGDGPARLSRMNATAGKINLNGGIYPKSGAFSPPTRWQSLQALLQNMPNASGTPSTLVNGILQHALTTGGRDFAATGLYDYAGKVCEVAGFADSGSSDWDKEVLIRNLASSLTTKSNVFSVWGVAQSIRKKPGNTNYGVFQTGDVVTGEKRFQAVVERYVWPGKDNSPGNGHVTASGSYDRVSPGKMPGQPPAYTGGTWETLDGPVAPTYPPSGATPGTWTNGAANVYTNSTIENADNPVGAVMKYRVVYFHYLND